MVAAVKPTRQARQAPSVPCLSLIFFPYAPILGCSCSPDTCSNEPRAVIGLHRVIV